ncbi:unnamed protein product, partial [Ixodes pacificus]
VIWSIIKGSFCSFKVNTKGQQFCRNDFNLTGLCNRSSCPLANSVYATIKEEEGNCYLYMKTIERAAFPNRLWEKVKLSKNFEKALEQINQHLVYWPRFVRQKCKQRLLKITQYIIRMRKLRLSRQLKIKRNKIHHALRASERVNEVRKLGKWKPAIASHAFSITKCGLLCNFFVWCIPTCARARHDNNANTTTTQKLKMGCFAGVSGTVEYVAAEDMEESDMSDLEDIADSDSSEEKEADAKRPTTSSLRKKRPHVEIEYEQEAEPSTSKINGKDF